MEGVCFTCFRLEIPYRLKFRRLKNFVVQSYFIWGIWGSIFYFRRGWGKNALPLYFLNYKWYDNETWYTLRLSYAK